jgi:hypothetical protein
MRRLQTPADATTTRRRSFVQTPTEIVRDPTLSFGAKALYGVIESYDWESLDSACFALQETLAKDLGCSDRTIRRYADQLLERGLIERKRTGRTNRYRVIRDRSDRSPVSDLIGQPCPVGSLSRRREEDEGSRRSRNAASEPETIPVPEPETTTTTTDFALPDLEQRAGLLLEEWEERVEEQLERRPRRTPQAIADARKIAATGTGPEFDELVRLALQGDRFTRRNWLRKFPNLECFEATRADIAAQPHISCEGCGRRIVITAEQDRRRRQVEADGREWSPGYEIEYCADCPAEY